jgi:hypothetical protein
MNITAIALAAATVFAAGSAAAASVSDVDYLKANRCKGLAAGMGSDTASLDAFIKAESRARHPMILQRGDDEFAKAKRATGKSESRERLSAELSGPCMAYAAPGKDGPSAR